MKPRHRLAALCVAVPGVATCVVALGLFIWTIVSNALPWHADQSAREHYLAVGEAYTHGFTTGFFTCFFLLVVAIGIAGYAHRGERRRSRIVSSVEAAES